MCSIQIPQRWHMLITLAREHLKRLRASPTSTEEELALARQRLQSDIKALRKWQFNPVPELHKYMKEINVDKPEKIWLLLPSDFSPADRAWLKLSDLAVVEYRLREGQAHNSIMVLCTTIRTKNFNTNLKMTEIYGTSATTHLSQPLSQDEQWGKGGVAFKASRSKDLEPWFWSVQ
ncbi:hypothetical protein K438DRAFT_1771701 [Mycena galopus ATCC 62051]|nr:hypothetical protein K438DRAFT_1771701 [Mycena galopus ATCC 62051]